VGQEIYSLKTYLQALDNLLEKRRSNGFVGMKWHALAYARDIHYPDADARSAEQCLDRIFRMPASGGVAANTPVGFDAMRPFQDFIQHHLVQRAIEMDWPVQIHTGTFGLSHGGQISHANPTHLVNLFLRYPQARFDLLHSSYPYMRELTALTKLFPNVYINASWFDILSPRAAEQYLREWISSVPNNKIFAFGGDQFSVLLSCANAEMVRDTFARILADEVTEGNMSEEYAVDTAARMLRENAWEHFRLEERWANLYEKQTPV
jgi:predicted TIM-barrel fold metal-dependent hydrolase